MASPFGLVSHAGLRAALDGDYPELGRCFEACAWKAVHILSGSIVEAVFTDYLVSSGKVKAVGGGPVSLTP